MSIFILFFSQENLELPLGFILNVSRFIHIYKSKYPHHDSLNNEITEKNHKKKNILAFRVYRTFVA